MKLLVVTESGQHAGIGNRSGDEPEQQTYCLAPGRKLEDGHAALPEIIRKSQATHVAFCSRQLAEDRVGELISRLRSEQDSEGSPVWAPHTPGSPADFLIRAIGLSLAGIWLPAWQAGLLVVPASQLLESPLDPFHPLRWLIQAGYGPSEQIGIAELDWSDNLLALPALVPWKGRCTANQREWISQADRWLPAVYVRNTPDFAAIQAGLLLWLDELEPSHSYSQSVQFTGKHRAADYWHAIMHRREPDYGNSKYWFRQVGEHPIFPELALQASRVAAELEIAQTFAQPAEQRWNPAAFVDFCSNCTAGSPTDLLARRTQAIEMILLLRQTLTDARES